MQFQPGQSGNPAGRPRGARNRRTIAAERLFDEAADDLTQTLIGLARGGHPVALRMCMDRISPTKDRPVPFELPAMATAVDAVAAMGSVMQGVADGEITPREAAQVSAVIQAFAGTLSTAELESRLDKIEAMLARTSPEMR